MHSCCRQHGSQQQGLHSQTQDHFSPTVCEADWPFKNHGQPVLLFPKIHRSRQSSKPQPRGRLFQEAALNGDTGLQCRMRTAVCNRDECRENSLLYRRSSPLRAWDTGSVQLLRPWAARLRSCDTASRQRASCVSGHSVEPPMGFPPCPLLPDLHELYPSYTEGLQGSSA